MKVAVFGISGQLGSDVAAALASHQVIPVEHARADIRDEQTVTQAVHAAMPDWVINCAAMTNVEACERDALAAFAANAGGARNVAMAAEACGARLIHVSTDYVFDGEKRSPYLEGDFPRPLNIYGSSKLAGEWAVRAAGDKHVIVRTSGIYGLNACRGKGTNFVETMMKRAESGAATRVVTDEVLTPTFSVDLAHQIAVMIEHGVRGGVYHATNSGSCSWFEFAREIFRHAG
ncbi:MAG TPA: dTDP-4-dehydrorhamnose reductase, partial [Candidatus Krumholzibacteria bacterium]|nr:dTDP-4-dehydrorhamnose reductase [Candidatus Krumholzibacteria bacterium]